MVRHSINVFAQAIKSLTSINFTSLPEINVPKPVIEFCQWTTQIWRLAQTIEYVQRQQ